jgi:amino acid permease
MSASKWMKWLSVIALILIVVPLLIEVWNTFTPATGRFEIADFPVLFLAIWAVIVSFKKDSSALVSAKKK